MSKPAQSTLSTNADIINWHCRPEDSNDVQLLENDSNLIQTMNHEHQAYVRTLSNKAKDAIFDYTDTESDTINSYLALPANKRQTDDHLENLIHSLRQTIHNAPSLTQPLIVYRGIRSKNYNHSFIKALQNAKIGDEIQLPDGGFISTSVSPQIALRFARAPCCFLVIYLPTGTHGLFFGEDSSYTDELEYLLSDQQRFRYFRCENSPTTISTFDVQDINVYHLVAI